MKQVNPSEFSADTDLRLPGHLNKSLFDFSKAIKFDFSDRVTLLLVPPTQFLQDKPTNRSWLLLRKDDLGNHKAQEIMLLPEKSKKAYKMFVVRNSGRMVATGKMDLIAGDHTRFEIKLPVTRIGGKAQLLSGTVKNNSWDIQSAIS